MCNFWRVSKNYYINEFKNKKKKNLDVDFN